MGLERVLGTVLCGELVFCEDIRTKLYSFRAVVARQPD